LKVALGNISSIGSIGALGGESVNNAFDWDVSTKWNVINASVGIAYFFLVLLIEKLQ